MSKNLLKGVFAVAFALAIAAPAAAQNAGGGGEAGLGADESGAASQTKILQSDNNYFGVRYQCKDASASFIQLFVRDLFLAGDIRQGTIHKGNAQARFARTANVSQFVPGAAAFGPGVYSPGATLNLGLGNVKGVFGIATDGNSNPAGLPAGWDILFNTNGFNLTCARKQVVNGSASS